jgi:hypothetical protein
VDESIGFRISGTSQRRKRSGYRAVTPEVRFDASRKPHAGHSTDALDGKRDVL